MSWERRPALRVSPNICRVTPKAASRGFILDQHALCECHGTVRIRTLDVNRTQFERSRIAPMKALGTCEREVTRHAVRLRPSSPLPSGCGWRWSLASQRRCAATVPPSPRGAFSFGPRRISCNAQRTFDRDLFYNAQNCAWKNRDRSRAWGKKMRHRFERQRRKWMQRHVAPTATRGTKRCFALFRRVRFATVHHSLSSTTHFLSALSRRSLRQRRIRMYCWQRQRPIWRCPAATRSPQAEASAFIKTSENAL